MPRLRIGALAALVLAYALGPMATQILTPAVPFLHRDFGIPMAAAQMLISLSFAVIAAMTLIYGPLADRYGRRPVIVIGTALFCLGSLMAALAPWPSLVIAGRVVQAAGSAAALTLTRTIIHDIYGPEHSGRALARLTTVMIFVPMLAPMAGGVLLDHVGWRAVFGACFFFGVIALTLVAVGLPETRRPERSAHGLARSLRTFGELLSDRSYVAPALYFGFIMAAIFATQAALPYLIVEVLGGTAAEYGAWFGVACLFYVAGNAITARWGQRLAPLKLIMASAAGSLGVAIAGMAAVWFFAWSTALLFAPVIALYFLGALAVAPVQAQALAARPQHSGTASGLLSGLQMALGAVVVQLVGFAHDGTPYPLFCAVIGCAAAAFIAGASLYVRLPRARGVAYAQRATS